MGTDRGGQVLISQRFTYLHGGNLEGRSRSVRGALGGVSRRVKGVAHRTISAWRTCRTVHEAPPRPEVGGGADDVERLLYAVRSHQSGWCPLLLELRHTAYSRCFAGNRRAR